MTNQRSRRNLLKGGAIAGVAGALTVGVFTADAAHRERGVPACPTGWVDVTDRAFGGGAATDGSADSTAAINSAIQAAAGGTVYFPAGRYLVSPDLRTGVALSLDKAFTRLLFASNATVTMTANLLDHYAIVSVTAPDCAIENGELVGDNDVHTGASGEWGHCIDVRAGADRLLVRNTRVRNAWGDGVYIDGHPADVVIENVVADNNRRQGLSIVDALRPNVLGGVYRNTGVASYTAPGAGIDIEPNPDTGQSVLDARLTNVVFSANKGAGLLVSSNGKQVSAHVVACRSEGNGTPGGFLTMGGKTAITIEACASVANSGPGFAVTSDGVSLSACSSRGNKTYGFTISGTGTTLSACIAADNSAAGYYLDPAGASIRLSASTASRNVALGQTGPDFDVYAPRTIMSALVATTDSTSGADYGFAIRPGAGGCVAIGCTAQGSFRSGSWIDLSGDAIAAPVPGSDKPQLTGSRRGESPSTAAVRAALVALGLAVDATTP